MARELFIIELRHDGEWSRTTRHFDDQVSGETYLRELLPPTLSSATRLVRYVPEDAAAETKLAYHRARAKPLLEKYERDRVPGELFDALRELVMET